MIYPHYRVHRGYWLLNAGFFVCGFHIAFITTPPPNSMTIPDPKFDNNAQNTNRLLGKILRIDFYIKWRIADVANFYRATAGGDDEVAALRLGGIVKDGIKGVIARRTIQQVVAAERAEFTGEILKTADASTRGLGVQLVDVRVKKIDLPEEVSESVFSRMRQDFDRQAKQLRAEGEENAEKLRSESDRQKTEILAEAYREAQIIRGEGDAKSAEIYAKAYSRNPEFYSFYRNLEAYRKSIGTENDVLVISPDSDFFKYLNRSTSSR